MNKKKWLITTIFIVIVTNAITFLGANTVSLMLPNGKVVVSREDYNNFKSFSKLYEIKSVLHELYDGKIDNEAIEEGAIKGMTSALNDPYTVFMDKKEYTEFNTQTEGNYSGIGLQVQSKENKIVIADIFEESPAKKAELLPKDVIEKVNGTVVSGKDLDKAVTMMKGQEGTEVTLTIFREEKGSFDVKLKRAKINMVTVKGEMLENSIGYVSVSMFDENTSKNFKNELDVLSSKGAKAFIIDLRGNPGGLLDECVDMVSNFIPKDKVIVSTIDKYKREEKYNSTGGKYVGVPLVLLTDGGSASASEIFSGAIRDYKAGTLIGEKTFGKGVVQRVLETGEGTALKVTVSKYYTPNGENIHGTGIKPDIEVKYPEELLKKPYDRTTDPQFKKALEIIKGKL